MQSIIGHSDSLVAGMAALSAFSAFLMVSWPYLARDPLGARVLEAARQRDAIRSRERAKLHASEDRSLTSEPRKVFKNIFDRMNLTKQSEDGEMVRKLRMAGYRGHGPVVTFVAVRLLVPVVTFAVASLYVFVIIPFDQTLIVKLGIVIAAAYAGCHLPSLYVKNRISKRQKAIRRAWPDALDLLLICVEAGMGVESAFRKVSEEILPQSAELADELGITTAELAYLPDRRKAYENLAIRTGLPGVKSVVTSLIQAEKYGTPIGQSLRVLARESRDLRMSEAEKKAAGLPPKLTVPMILFFLPVLFAVIVTPAAIQIARTR